MSADNYIYVSKTEDGEYAVSYRIASAEYEDECTEPPMEAFGMRRDSEGWRLDGDSAHGDKVFATHEEACAAATRRPDWIVPAPTPLAKFDDVDDAVRFAHKVEAEMVICEYGVSLALSVLQDYVTRR